MIRRRTNLNRDLYTIALSYNTNVTTMVSSSQSVRISLCEPRELSHTFRFVLRVTTKAEIGVTCMMTVWLQILCIQKCPPSCCSYPSQVARTAIAARRESAVTINPGFKKCLCAQCSRV